MRENLLSDSLSQRSSSGCLGWEVKSLKGEFPKVGSKEKKGKQDLRESEGALGWILGKGRDNFRLKLS